MTRIFFARFFLFAYGFLICFSANAERVRFIRDPHDALQVRVDLVQQAKKEILVEYFSVWNDDQSAGGIALLLDAARRGVKVKVILDAFSHRIPTSMFAAMNALSKRPDGTPGIEVRLYNDFSLNIFDLTKRDHSKMIIVDGKALLAGGRNIGDKYFDLAKSGNYDDLDVLIDGPVVQRARTNFLTSWQSKLLSPPRLGRHSEDELAPAACFYQEGSSFNCEQSQNMNRREIAAESLRLDHLLFEIFKRERDDLVRANTGTDWFKKSIQVPSINLVTPDPKRLVTRRTAFLADEVLDAIEGARKTVRIVSPYVVPTKRAMSVFSRLLAKGVEIQIITNSLTSTDSIMAQAGYRYMKDQMIPMGVELHEYKGPNTLHAKALMIDGREVLVGSFNIDPRSFYLNREIGLEIDQPGALAGQLEKLMNGFMSNSVLVSKYGQEHNQEWRREQDEKSGKLLAISLLQLVMPVLIHQL